jgi:hypothetical protein
MVFVEDMGKSKCGFLGCVWRKESANSGHDVLPNNLPNARSESDNAGEDTYESQRIYGRRFGDRTCQWVARSRSC